MSPTARSKQHAEKLGYVVAVTEKWIPYARVRHDLFGMFDLLMMRHGEPLLGIQTTTGDHHANRRAKLLEAAHYQQWKSTGSRAAVWSWSKQGKAGKRKVWKIRQEEL